MNCKNCEYSIDETMSICPKCGKKINGASPKNKSNLLLILIVLAIFLAGCAGVWYFFGRASSPKNVMMSHFAKVSEKLSGVMKSENALTGFIKNNKNMSLDTTMELSLDKALGLDFETLKLKMNYTDRPEEKKAKYLVDLLLDQESLLKLDGALSNEKMYVKVPETMKNYYSLAIEYASVFEFLNTKDYAVFTDIIVEVLKDGINEKDIKEENVTVSLNGKDTKVKKYSYNVNKNVMKTLVESFTTKVKANDKALQILVDVMGKTKEEVIKMLEDSSKELDKVSEFSFDLVTYVRGMNEVVITEIASKGVALQYLSHDQKEGFTFTNTVDGKKEEMFLTWVNENNTYKVEGKILDTLTISGTIKSTDKGDEIDLALEMAEGKLKIKYNEETTEVEKNVKYSTKGQGTFSITVGGISLDVGFKLDATIAPAGEIKIDVEGAKDINSLTEEDMATLQSELSQVPVFQLLLAFMFSPEEL